MQLLIIKTIKNTNSGRKNLNCGEVNNKIKKCKRSTKYNILKFLCFLNSLVNKLKINNKIIPKLKILFNPERCNQAFIF